jgi:hypothetical protein
MDWSAIAKGARIGFEKGANEWILGARVRGGVIQGPNAELTPGSLTSDVSFESVIAQSMTSAGAPALVSQAVARELWSAWKEWADGFRMSIPGAFPTFAAYPGPQAPPTPAAQAGYPLVRGTSPGEYRLQAATLQSRLNAALRTAAGRDLTAMSTEVVRLTTWIESSFRDWKSSAQIMGLMGRGPVPAFAPPYVPVGPVISADSLSSVSVVAGPRFGNLRF